MKNENIASQILKFVSQSERPPEPADSVRNDISLGDRSRPLTQKTKTLYIRYVKTLHKRYAAVHPEAHRRDASPMDLVDILLDQYQSLRPKTFSSYRTGLLYWLGTCEQDNVVQLAIQKLTSNYPRDGYKGHRPGVTATKHSQRSMRARTFERQKFEKLKAALIQRSSRLNDARTSNRPSELLLWLQAGLASGLRPVEWQTAQWQDIEKGELLVRTAKEKPIYTLPHISHLMPPKNQTRVVQIELAAIPAVNQHLLSVRRHLDTGATFQQYYNNNRNYLHLICLEIFGPTGKKFTLYMMRGQFAANMKKAGFSLEEVGEQMGCGWHVASVNYGNKSAGHRGKGVTLKTSPTIKEDNSLQGGRFRPKN